jgi:UDP-N-acetylmuramyl pentapeptide phosphotransferase/UDP-N-acetylglucosamine-1-phosphate transferase
VAGVLAGCALAGVRGDEAPWAAVAAATVLALIGLADDRTDLPAVARLGGQVLAGAALGLALGGPWLALAGALVAPVTVNAVNFMDGINGITGLTMGVWGVATFAAGRAHGAEDLAVLGALAAGAALGFLPWNLPVARLFLGDVGSYLFGGLVAAGLLVAWSSGANVALVAAPLALYLADTGSVILSRIRRGEPLFEAHRQHVYQRLVWQLGLSHSVVASGVALLALAITGVWLLEVPALSLALTLLLCAGYLATPSVLCRRAARRPA